ncbi:LOW QUALITY PROTEIN: hypothetical protein Cgig2_002147 [Carnegiea gigantea]|uniref:Uncharacterized protein n=1 Tax=Carnegiea gigantea TaxID=171969 RepID=A0A9Q1QQ51_9CARY|nr:LOW QUALITY PROTEIN: hypothetical protein Cgig2_002147 [Carnegiea gigantea]
MNGMPTWFKMKYIKLPGFCYAYGLLGYVYRRCVLYDSTIPKTDLQYGSWIRATPIKTKAKEMKRKFCKKDKGCSTCGNLVKGTRVRLNFDKSSVTNMNIDTEIINVGGEIAKRKEDNTDKTLWSSLKASRVCMLTVEGVRLTIFTFLLNGTKTVMNGGSQVYMGSPKQQTSLRHLTGGDLNEILYNFEKCGGPLKSQAILDAFRDTLNVCDLFDLGFLGQEFTWWNGQDVVSSVEERLDQFCANSDWSTLFSNARVTHMDDDSSYHLPIHLKVFKFHTQCKKTKRRRFDNFWALDDRCEGVISNAWISINSDDPATRVVWGTNQEAFGNIQLEIKKHLNLLKQTSDARARKLIFNTISDLRRKVEVLWCQRSRTDFLKFGDRNSGWFHNKANRRKSTNHIAELKDVDGQIVTPVKPETSLLRVGDLIDRDRELSVKMAYHLIMQVYNDDVPECSSPLSASF